MDDTFVILKQDKRDEFLQHMNSVDPAIQFTTEEQRQDGSMPFLDILVTPQEDGTLTTTVYRKPTHTDQYLQWDRHLNMACKYSVINTLTHRAKAVCSSSQLLKEELKHLEEVLTQCKYPKFGYPKDTKRTRTEEKQEEQRKEHQNTEKMSHSGTLYPRTM